MKLGIIVLIVTLLAGCSSNVLIPKTDTVKSTTDSLGYYMEQRDVPGLESLFSDVVLYYNLQEEQTEALTRDELMQPIVRTIMLFKEISRYRIYDRTTISTEHSVIVEARVEFKGTTIFGETGTADYPVIIELAYLMDQWWICGVSHLL